MKFRKKPIVIEAEQFFPDQQPWPVGVDGYRAEGEPHWRVQTVHGYVEIQPGCWIIPEQEPGKAYPITPEELERTYEVVE